MDSGISLRPIGRVSNDRYDLDLDRWGGVESTIELDAGLFDPAALRGLEEFSHLEVIYHLDRIPLEAVHRGARHPRNDPRWPEVGIFAQRAAARPNRLAVTRCRLLGIAGLRLRVTGLDAVNGTPVLDIKPYLREFGPAGEVRQPPWATELMHGYFSPP